jgi:MFS superfamily sulfate permease-like transporter
MLAAPRGRADLSAQVQDAGLIFLSAMASSIVSQTRERGASHDEILATVLCWLALSTAMLGLGLMLTGAFRLASLVQYLPMPVVRPRKLSLSLSLSLSLTHSLTHSFSLSLFLSYSLFFSLFLSLFLSPSFSPSSSLPLPLSLFLSLFLSASFSPSSSLPLCLSFSLLLSLELLPG